MKKYYTVVKNELQRQLAFRLNLLSYRVGNLLEIVVQIIVWTVIFQKVDVVQGYARNEMISYVVFGWLFVFLTENYGLENIVEHNIFEGKVSEFLVKPISYLKYIFSFSLGRMSVALVSSIGMMLLVILFFRDQLIFNLDPVRALLLLGMVGAGLVLKIYFAVMIGMIAFWTQRIVGIDYSLGVFIKFFSGVYFPLVFLPPLALAICKALPFMYVFYVPTQLYLGKLSVGQGAWALVFELAWIVVMYFLTKLMWTRGLRKYEGVGI
ncbi:hypothetical protein EPO05_03080 [Patescibacteria group bacterium]|nr:MAG: hypothetical protein EPO05_03080 [Patescibacteria group bacterium]